MAEFIIGRPLRSVARRNEPLRQLLWRVDFALLWLIQKILQILPIDPSSRFGERLGRFIGPLMREKSRIFKANFAIAFPNKSEPELDALVKDAWGRAGRVLGEYPHLHTLLAEPGRLDIEIRGQADVYANTANPCVFTSAHLSNWEVICSSLARLGIPNASLYSPPTNPLLDKMLLDSRAALNCQLVPRDNSARTLMRAMQSGRSIGAVIDRRVDDGVPVEFFGQDKLSTIMPARLALKFKADLIPVQVCRLRDARFKVIFHPPIRPQNPAADEAAQVLDMTQQLHAQFEDWIRANPEDWFCSKRLWAKAKQSKLDIPQEAGNDADIDTYAA